MNDWKKEISKKLEALNPHRDGALKILVLLGLSFIITYLVYPSREFGNTSLHVGDIAPETIRANRSYIIVDRQTTELKKREASDNTPLLFIYDASIRDELLKNISTAFRSMRSLDEEKATFREFNDILGLDLSESHFRTLSKAGFTKAHEKLLTSIVSKMMSRYIVMDKELVAKNNLPTIFVSPASTEKPGIPEIIETSRIIDLQTAREEIALWEETPGVSKKVGKEIRDVLTTIAGRLIKPNLKFDEERTRRAEDDARDAIKDATINLEKGEVLIRQGDRITKTNLVILEGLREIARGRTRGILFWGIFLFHLVFILIAYLFAIAYFKNFKPTFKDIVLLGTTLITTIMMVDGFQFIGDLVKESISHLPLDTFNFFIPVFASGMLIALVLNFEVAFVYSIGLSIILGIASEYSTLLSGRGIYYSFYCFAGSLVGIKGTYKSAERITIFKAGLVLGLFNTAIVIILTFLESKLFLLGTFTDYFYPMAMAFSSGILSSIIVLGITPFVELFGYTTDIKLLELANTDHPLLSKLALEAPGTYHHSFVVSRLAESAADAIGVNSLLVKVACLYHDIGKVLKPSYFIENQDGKHNKHDKLSPHMSSLIIQSHVKEGIELAKKAQLPKVIIDLIPQHHGTSLISYFYNKARKVEDKDVEKVNELDYRYTGPRPKSKEGAIIMLADSIEATARSLEEPTPGKLKEVVDNTIRKRFTDGQLDECDLTFNDLNIISESFTNTLIKSIYHPRISYILEEQSKTSAEPTKNGVEVIKNALREELVKNGNAKDAHNLNQSPEKIPSKRERSLKKN